MARKLSDKEIKDIAADIIKSTPELKQLPTSELKQWLDRSKIKYEDEDIKALEDELVGFYGININERHNVTNSDEFKELMAQEVEEEDTDFLNRAESFILDETNDIGERAKIVGKYDQALGIDELTKREGTDQEIVDGFIDSLNESGPVGSITESLRKMIKRDSRPINEAAGAQTTFDESEPDYEVIVDPDGQIEIDRAHKIAQDMSIEGSVNTGFLVTAKTLLKQFVNMLKGFDIKVVSILDGKNNEVDPESVPAYQQVGRKTNKYNYANRMREAKDDDVDNELMQRIDKIYNALEASDAELELSPIGNNFGPSMRSYGFSVNNNLEVIVQGGQVDLYNPETGKDVVADIYDFLEVIDNINENASLYGTPLTGPRDLEKGKIYVWCGGAELLDIRYIGLAVKNPDIKVGSSMGKGFIFQWLHDEKYLELSMNAIRENVIFKEEPEQIEESTMAVSKKLFQTIYNMKPKDRTRLLDEILKIAAGPIKDRTKMAAEALSKQPTEYKQALKVIHPQLYKSIYEGEAPKRFPMIAECDESGTMTVNPLYEALKSPKSKLKKVKITNEFEDDNLPCINAVAYIDNKRYKFSDWHLESKTVKKYYLAESGDRGAMQGIRNRLNRLGNEFIREHKSLQRELHAAKVNEEAATAKNEAKDKIQQLFDTIKKLDNTKVKDKKEIKELEAKIAKLSKENGFTVDEIASMQTVSEEGHTDDGPWRQLTPEDNFEAQEDAIISDQSSSTHVFVFEPSDGRLSILGTSDKGNTGQIDILGLTEEIVHSVVQTVKDKNWAETKEALDGMADTADEISYDIITEAVDDEYFQVETKLRDICFQFVHQQLTQEEAVTQINDVLKDSEELQAAFINIAPEALVDEVINYYGWTESDLSEASDPVADDVDARFKEICAQYYADLLPTTDAIAKSKELLDNCKDSHSDLVEECAGLDDESLMIAVMSHFGWNVFDLVESVKK